MSRSDLFSHITQLTGDTHTHSKLCKSLPCYVTSPIIIIIFPACLCRLLIIIFLKLSKQTSRTSTYHNSTNGFVIIPLSAFQSIIITTFGRGKAFCGGMAWHLQRKTITQKKDFYCVCVNVAGVGTLFYFIAKRRVITV